MAGRYADIVLFIALDDVWQYNASRFQKETETEAEQRVATAYGYVDI